MKLFSNVLICLFLIGFNSSAQETLKAINKLKNETNAVVTINRTNDLAEFVRFPAGNALGLDGTTLKQKAFSFLNDYKEIYDIQSVEQTLQFDIINTDNYGLKHVILKQFYEDVPVFDGQLRFHFDANNKLTAINGNYIPKISKLNPIPSVSANQANMIALTKLAEQGLNHSGNQTFINSNKLYVFPKGLIQGHVTSHFLVYEVEVTNELDVREFLYINAHTGALVEQFTGIAHAMNRKVYEGNTGNLVWEEGDALPGTLTIWQQNEVQASGHVYNFFKNAFAHISYNGADAQMRTINNNPNIDCPNANWNGATANYCNGTASDDVIAHEWGHAYTQYTSGLIYAYQSGAINESYSDIWGETVDILNNYEDASENLAIRTTPACNSTRWKIGEDATAFGGAIRDMWNPPCNGDPGKVTDGQYRCGEFDSGGVHSNSGIPNHAYALLVDGGAYNGQVISGLGFTKAAHIFWRAQNVYLTPTSDFTNLADALEAACSDLMGINLQGLSTTNFPAGLSGQILTASDLQSVTNAILAVELRINPEACGYEPILAATPDLCEASVTNPLFYEDWETGMDGWSVNQLPTNSSTWQSRDWAIASSLPMGREGTAIFGIDPINGNCTSDLENGIIQLESPIIIIPNITTGTFDMAFNHYVATEANWDGGNIKYRLNGGLWTLLPASAFLENPYNDIINPIEEDNDNPMQGQEAFTGTDGGSLLGSWGQSVINLSALGVMANSTVQFRFELGTDGCNGNEGWYIDELIIYNCSAVLSVSESENINNSIQIYPNPSNGTFILKKTAMIDLLKAEIFDINGHLIKNIDLKFMQTERNIDISNFAAGIYFMSVSSKAGMSTIKIIKQ
ncbi:MAG TPA: M4 family metallopeptidase [Aquaticitalea sp.]|nr:M4 family metallopeptidase [Aquaticitalea sp.]